MSGLDFLDDALAALERADLLRVTRSREELPGGAVHLCSNDYLGLAARPLSPASVPGGSGASGLVWGYGEVHARAEDALAGFTGAQACLLFTSGYAANVGTIAALAGRDDLIVSDALNHASLIDGCRLSGARVVVTPHLDVAAVDEALRSDARRRFIVTESYFSMDGDSPDLAALRAVADAHGAALVLDEAHAFGVLGPRGRGLAAAAGIVADVRIGTLGKAFGLAGAFVVGSRSLRAYLWNRARSYVFSTAVSPSLAAEVPARVAEVGAADPARAHLANLAEAFRATVGAQLGVRPPGAGPVVPIVVGDAAAAVAASRELLAGGWVVQAIRPPTVPAGTSRLRVTLRADLEVATVQAAATAVAQVVGRRVSP